MGARETSAECYAQIKASGLICKIQFSVYDCIFRRGPITQGECVDILQRELNCGNNSGTIASRFAELKHLGVIVEVGKRPCNLTSRKCFEWDVTNKLPVEYERKTKDQIIKELTEEIERLKNSRSEIQDAALKSLKDDLTRLKDRYKTLLDKIGQNSQLDLL